MKENQFINAIYAYVIVREMLTVDATVRNIFIMIALRKKRKLVELEEDGTAVISGGNLAEEESKRMKLAQNKKELLPLFSHT